MACFSWIGLFLCFTRLVIKDKIVQVPRSGEPIPLPLTPRTALCSWAPGFPLFLHAEALLSFNSYPLFYAAAGEMIPERQALSDGIFH